ncbi:MAG: hypothetical protein KA109_07495 [Saprospiraceae bacterium]|nr:hypothetical protein [Saprospiraceae bacterium]MBK6479932.1 hypothetical protein [Saprospiraceae bacterium]MBK6815209.1 hypothetical protein [Saprospiraceae bacterium]MBK7372247.1 hypothetical protein [Saprospiraceae bacterium]MBK7435289.1 hypothetical protein [Saprospiraceae bacterium]
MKTRIYYILFLAMALAHMNCSKSNNATCAKNFSWQQELSAETSALTQAASAYGQNPTPANCAAYKTAGTNYLNKADDVQSCATAAGQGAEFNQAIDQARQSLNNIQC